MDRFIDYQSFPEIEQASGLIAILDSNNIPYEIDDSAARFKLVASTNSPLNQVIVKIREIDIEKANLLQADKPDIKIEDHYLYTFSDKDIIDVIANPDEWTKDEQSIAGQIVKQRGLSISAEDIKSARSKKIIEDKKMVNDKQINRNYGWFMTIGLLSILNTVIVAFNWKVHFIFGLAYTQIIDGVLYSLLGGFKIIGILISSLFSGLFILFWYYAKAYKNWAYIIGLVIYGLDLILFVFYNDWLSTGFHVFAFIFILTGYLKLLESKNKK